MADVKISMMLNDGGTINKKTGETKLLNQELTKTQKLARGVPLSSSQRRATDGDMVNTEMERFSRARGTIGTGAAGRDFANQAQGLGGLVRVYATFAANLFAATAAFTALKNAADTTNLIKGLEQLGVASGVNLPKVAKDLEAAAGGAISLRDAMTATAQASSAGMTAENIKRMGDVARNASQALGVDMSNALDRLSRGITKLEPELLDEIGIFTRTEQASEDYARSIGKSATALTSFEKRMAFANAVLAEGEQKFGAIALQTNPYNKLLATLKNVTQTGLELVNKVLGPLVNALAQSPMALAGVLAAIGVTLLKQVIPVIGEWRAGLRSAADDAAKTAESIKKSFGDEFQSKLESRFKIPDLQKSLSQTEAQIAKIQGKQVAGAPIPKGLEGLAFTKATEADEKTIKSVEKLIAKRKEYVETGMKGTKTLSDASRAAYTEELTYLNKKSIALQEELRLKDLLAQRARQEAALQAAFGKAQAVADKPLGRFDPETLLSMQYESAIKRRDRLATVSAAAENARVLGVRASWALLNQEIEKNGVTGLNKFITRAQGGLAAVGARIMGVVGSLGAVGAVVGTIVGAFSLLSMIFSKNAAEAQKASTSLDDLKSSGENLDRVLDALEKRKPLEKISTQSMAATSTAIADLISGIEKAIKDTDASIAARGWWDSFTNALSFVIGRSEEQKLQKTISQSLGKVLNASLKSPELVQLRQKIAQTLNLGTAATSEEILAAINISPNETIGQIKALVTQYDSAAQSGKVFSNNLTEIKKKFQDLRNELSQKGTVVDIVSGTTTAFSDLSKIIDGPVFNSIAGMRDFLNNIESLSMVPDNLKNSLISAQPAINSLTVSLQNSEATIQNNTKLLQDYDNFLKSISGKRGGEKVFSAAFSPTGVEMNVEQAKKYYGNLREQARKALEDAANDSARSNAALQSYKDLFKNAIEAGLLNNSKVLETLFGNAIKLSRIQTQQSALSKITESPETIKRSLELTLQQINLEERSQTVQQQLLVSQELTRLSQEKLTLALEKNTFIQSGDFKAAQEVTKRIQAIEGVFDQEGKLVTPGREQGVRAAMRGFVSMQDLRTKFGLDPETAQSLSKLSAGLGQAREQADQKRITAGLEADLRLTAIKFDDQAKELERQKTDINLQISRLQANPAISALDLEQQASDLRIKLNLLEEKLAGLPAQRQAEINTLAAKVAKVVTPEDLASIQARVFREEAPRSETFAAQREIESQESFERRAKLLDNTKELNKLRELGFETDLNNLEKQNDLVKIQSDFDKQRLQILLETFRISPDFYNRELRALELANIEREKTVTLQKLELQYNRDVFNLQAQIEQQAAEQRGVLTPQQAAAADAQGKALQESYRNSTQEALKLYNNQKSLLLLNPQLNESQRGLLKIYEDTFSKMGDVIVDFVSTGKLSFKSLIDDMLKQILRLYLNQFFMSMFRTMLPWLPGLGGASATGAGTITGGSGLKIPGRALGAAYDRGIEYYAKGGAFTNSIVDKPTMFRFANGTGLMGEAGPEAIMPLKRDSQGNLGVRGDGSNVEVVVHNYSNAPATTQETTDSRGNRRIEVVVGEMTAGEVTRGGSMTNRAIRGTFGVTPQLIRR